MDSLWAPWRIKYIRGEKEAGCFLCRKPQAAADAENHILIRGRCSFALLNTFPYNPGHLMVAPYRHTAELGELGEQELAELMALTVRCQALLQRVMNPEGFNIGINLGKVAGAGVLDHLHLHIVPRWNGDTNYLPVLADTRVMPQALDELYAQLHAALGAGA